MSLQARLALLAFATILYAVAFFNGSNYQKAHDYDQRRQQPPSFDWIQAHENAGPGCWVELNSTQPSGLETICGPPR